MSQNETVKIPKWKCHKEVEAFKITTITFFDKEAVALDGEGGLRVIVDDAYAQKHKPMPGGYYVRYADGYESFSPPDAFESGYTKIA